MSSPLLGTQGTAISNSSILSEPGSASEPHQGADVVPATKGSGGCILALRVLEQDQKGQNQRPMRSTHQSAALYFRSRFRDSSFKMLKFSPLTPLRILKSKVTRLACHSFREGTLHLGSQQPTRGLIFATKQSALLEPGIGKAEASEDVWVCSHSAHHCCR